MVRAGHLAWIGSIAVSMLGVYCAYTMIMHSVRPRTVFVACDSFISHTSIEQVRAQVSPELVWITPIKDLFNGLHTIITSLEDIQIQYKSSGCAVVKLTSGNPCFRINRNLVMTQAGNIVRETEFKSSIISVLPHINLTDTVVGINSSCSQEYIDFLTQIPANFFTDYQITIQDKTVIKLVAHTLPITLVAWYKTRFSQELLKGIEQLIERIKQLSQHAMYKQKKWLIDVRMTKKIILTPV